MSLFSESVIRQICLSILLVVCLTINYSTGWNTDSDLWTLTMMLASSIGLDMTFGAVRSISKKS